MLLRKGFQNSDKTAEETGQEPFRAELYSSGQLDKHAKLIAANHLLLQYKVPDTLLKRLDSNERKLVEVYDILVENIRSGKAINPAGEWLLDNFYLIEEQIILARKHLPKGYSEGLPCISNNSEKVPRVYDITLEIINHSDGRVDVNSLSNFVTSYQSEMLLMLGELWAIPIMLRLAVIENLRRLSNKIALDIIDHNLADYWADRLIEQTGNDPAELILVIADMVRSRPLLNSSFVAAFTRKLQGHGNTLALPLSWMEGQLALNGSNGSDLIGIENQKQASDQVSIRNSIGTLKFINAHDWPEFVESLSNVEHVLRKEIAGIYPSMDFPTRDTYRHVIENIAKSCPLSETEVAEAAVKFAAGTLNRDGAASKASHIGYYLIDKGRKQLQRFCGAQIPVAKKILEVILNKPVRLYICSIMLLSALLTGGISYLFFETGNYSVLFSVLFLILSFFCTTQLATAIINWLITILVKPKLLPRMDYSKYIPDDKAAMVVIPTMLVSKDYIEDMIEALEIRYLANPCPNLCFALLTDFNDALLENMPEDAALALFAKDKIELLNLKYKSPDSDTFFLFHRGRTWNKMEGKWMGFERKRGKLSALNGLLRGHGLSDFMLIYGDWESLKPIKYIITLDSDTQLPADAAWKLIATMAHPLNKAIYNNDLKRITDGYGILQPQVTAVIPNAGSSFYTQMQSGQVGVDPYTRASSDVYQDLFAEGSFIGKGIYDIDMFEKALQGKFQTNRILSHDLLEGCYARSGLVSDVLLYEENPVRYQDDIKRRRRWIRGDWQIGAWMLPFVTNENNRLTANRLSLLSRWKIMDNLRRSLLPLFLMLFLILGWTVLPYSWFWTLTITLIITVPDMAGAGWRLLHKPKDLKVNAHLSEIGISVRDILMRFMFGIAMLPYEVMMYTGAIIQTNWRMIVSRRGLLEWASSASLSNRIAKYKGATFINMWFSPFVALSCSLFIIYWHPFVILVATPILILWLLAPFIVRWVNLPIKEKALGLTGEQYTFLHKTARKTWAFFETFVTADDHWLPPDNYQEEPVVKLAHRTSPTNMGLALLANLTAYDFGYISSSELLRRCSKALDTMCRLDRYKGHFYNWYDTVTLKPLSPGYISSVDSGNLIGHLLVLKQGLLNLAKRPVFGTHFFDGIVSTVQIIKDYMGDDHPELINKISAFTGSGFNQLSLSAIKTQLARFITLTASLAAETNSADGSAIKWIRRLQFQLEHALSDLQNTVPWLGLLPVPVVFEELATLDTIPCHSSVKRIMESHWQKAEKIEKKDADKVEILWLEELKATLIKEAVVAGGIEAEAGALAEVCEQLSTVSYDFLYEKSTKLLRIGYNVDEQRKDDSYYDLLASEARLGIFVAIAQGKLPQESWFSLGRLLTATGTKPILLSWSGSMFEYLMPQLVMPAFKDTLLYQTNRAMVSRQVIYADQRGVPWGISESAYNGFDAALNYQYRAFGVPGLGLKRGLEEDIVIAPYATAMALMVLPEKACSNLQLLSGKGFEGEYGFYEAIDYTPSRLPRNKKFEVIKSFMVHHQGMSFLSLSHLLLGKPMQQRFVSELRFKASLLLLQERIPRATVFHAHTAEFIERSKDIALLPERRITKVNTLLPEIQLLSNGRYHVMATNSGGGYSRWKDLAITRWREDAVTETFGIFAYIRDLEKNIFWSNTYQPVQRAAQDYEAVFSQGYIEYKRTDSNIETHTKIVVSPEDDVEMRRIRITNRANNVKILEVTSYAEIVMAGHASDEAHPAFSNLFVQTEILPLHKALMCTRRPRSEDEQPPWMFHYMDVQGVTVEAIFYETDRMKFIGRGNTVNDPLAMHQDELSGSEGSVLDPILAIRYRFSIKPGQTAAIDMIYGISETKEACYSAMHKYRDLHLRKRADELSWTHNQVLLRQLNVTETNVQLYDRLASSIVFVNPLLRSDAKTIRSNQRGQSGLWSHSVSGDLPIVLLHMHNPEDIEIARQLIQAHAYWRQKGVAVDLVIWNEEHGSYRQFLQEQISGLIIAESSANTPNNKSGSIYVKSADQVSPEDRILFESVARVVLSDNKGTLSEQINIIRSDQALPLRLTPILQTAEDMAYEVTLPPDLLFFNGIGGFSPDGKNYKIRTDKDSCTPAPWVNVIANPGFGTVVSESGSAYTWAGNAHEYRLTPWSNDPVSDIGGEAFYIRDEISGAFWSPAPFPAKGTKPYITTHGFGYSIFEHQEHGIHSEMRVFVDVHLPLKFITLKLKNESGNKRKLSASGYMEMVLGDMRSKTGMHLLSDLDADTGTLIFRNRYNSTFADRIVFFHVLGKVNSFTTDRSEFIGRNRTLKDPDALYMEKLSGKVGEGKDTCAAIQVKFDLMHGEEREIIFFLGSAESYNVASRYIARFKDADSIRNAFDNVQKYWDDQLGKIQVSTPDIAVNIMANGWLLYQDISCRLFARTGFYQSGGAFGFRDQLQDVLALLHSSPSLTREQIILSAAHQFTKGDVQHWWHPPDGRGVRTMCSDDLLWLPFVVSRYIRSTGDQGILSVVVGFLESRELQPGEESLYDLPQASRERASVYEHCVRSIKQGLHYGAHGLPLIGSGDWNDGMDKIGHLGQGESVWLAFFLYDVLNRFGTIARDYGDTDFSCLCSTESETLQKNIEASAWDGAWYLRAWFDNGTPLGSHRNEECSIDAIAQSWSVISGAGHKSRAAKAMKSLNDRLVRRDLKIIQLLSPAFDKSNLNPGYIKGYVPGVRENGGQYSHAAVWVTMAFAKLGDREKVYELLNMLLPINHSLDEIASNKYKVEPYVMAADVYANESHKGRGGWTWYTGSAGWMYQLIVDFFIGLERKGNILMFNPCLPLQWPSVEVNYRFGQSEYLITIYQIDGTGTGSWKVDDQEGVGNAIELKDDKLKYEVTVYIPVRSFARKD